MLSKHYLFKAWVSETMGALWDVPLGLRWPDTAPRPGTQDRRQAGHDGLCMGVSSGLPDRKKKKETPGRACHTRETQERAPREPPSPLRGPQATASLTDGDTEARAGSEQCATRLTGQG